MRQSQLFTKTRKEVPKDEVSKNATLLIRAGFIHKEMAGVYTLLPLGVRVLENIARIVREEMNTLSAVELTMTALQDPEIWKKTDRWDDKKIDNWFKTKLKNGSELGLGFTHEEQITTIMREYISSYKDLPVYAYQIQTKFRNELRAKSGILRGREFLMKDMYSFNRSQGEHDAFYSRVALAYKQIFQRVGIGDAVYYTYAAGGVFAPYSHEFQMETSSGEDSIYVHEEKRIAINEEIINDPDIKSQFNLGEFVPMKSVEVGNIFSLGTRFSESLGLRYKDESGNVSPVYMGSYGIGLGRLLGAIVEKLGDEKGLCWPEVVAPFGVHIISLHKYGDDAIASAALRLYEKLCRVGISALLDDRTQSPGVKLADADLIGIPVQIILGARGMEEGLVELKDRHSGETKKVPVDDVITFLQRNEGVDSTNT